MAAPFEEFEIELTIQPNEFKIRCLPEVFIGLKRSEIERMYFIKDAINEKLAREKEASDAKQD